MLTPCCDLNTCHLNGNVLRLSFFWNQIKVKAVCHPTGPLVCWWHSQSSHGIAEQCNRITKSITNAFECKQYCAGVFLDLKQAFDKVWHSGLLYKIKQVRTNISLADTLIPSSFIYLFYMGGAGPCDSIKIIFGYHGPCGPMTIIFGSVFRVSLQVPNLVWIGRSMCSRPQFTDLTYMGGTRSCGPMTIIFGSII